MPYRGDGTFLAGPTKRTRALWARLEELIRQEVRQMRSQLGDTVHDKREWNAGNFARGLKSASKDEPNL